MTKPSNKGTILLTLTLALSLIIGVTTLSFAGWGEGKGHNNHNGNNVQISDENFEAVQVEREAFFKQTKDIRRELRKNNALMQAEMASKEPDMAKLKTLQKTISALNSEFDEKRVAHMVTMRKINPDFTGHTRNCQGGMGGGGGARHKG